MTFREKLMREHPDKIDPGFAGGCQGCPKTYGYEDSADCGGGNSYLKCRQCWDRVIPGTEEVSDNVNHPSYYQGKHECIDEMIALFGVEAVKHFCMCNVYKYRFRATNKNGEEDLAKAVWYMDKLMELNDME